MFDYILFSLKKDEENLMENEIGVEFEIYL